MSLLLMSKILELFVKTLTVNQKYAPCNGENLLQSSQMQFSHKQRSLCDFFASFLKSTLSLNLFFFNMTLIAYVFPKLSTAKSVFRKMHNTARESTCQRVTNSAEICTAAPLLPFLIALRERELKKSLLVIFEILGLPVNTLTANDKYRLCYSGDWQQSFQIQLSKKQKTFPDIFSPFLKAISNFKTFEKMMTFLAYVFPKYGLRKTWLDKCLKSSISNTVWQSTC